MAASKARLGYGSKFYTGDTASPIGYTLLSEIAIINFADYTVAEIDVTHLLSPNTSEESIPGLLKPGTIELTGNYTGDTSSRTSTCSPWRRPSSRGNHRTRIRRAGTDDHRVRREVSVNVRTRSRIRSDSFARSNNASRRLPPRLNRRGQSR
jgi:hypothetical protein